MAHEFESGFVYREPAWHGLATVLDQRPRTWDEARAAAGMDWEPGEADIYELGGINPDGSPAYTPVEGFKRIYRDDTMATLGVVRGTYSVISHAEMGQVMTEILRTPKIRYETGGVLAGGRKVWMLALLDEPITVKGDICLTLPYLSVTNQHDGEGSLKVQATAVRVVCANTWHAAEMEGQRTDAVYSFRHSTNWRSRIEEARHAVTAARKSINTYVEAAEHLLTVPVSAAQRELFVAEFFPMPPVGMASDRTIGNVETSREALRTILASPTTEPVAHTAYGLVQAAGEYMDHVRVAKTWETRLNRSLLTTEKFKGRAVKLAQLVAAH